MNPLFLATVVLTLNFCVCQKSPHTWNNRTGIVQMFEWRFEDIATECKDFLAPKGFAAVQVSPINECLIVNEKNRPWWERYQPISYKIISRSGDENAFKDMVKTCNKAGIRVYVDVILNHMAGNHENATGVGGNTADPKTLSYPGVPYGPEDFNTLPCIITDWKNPTEQRNCDLFGLHDLNQTNSYVRQKLIAFLDQLVDLGVAGFRIDAAKHMWPNDLKYIYGRVKPLNTDFGFDVGERPFFYQEVIDEGDSVIHNEEYSGFGRISDFIYGRVISSYFRGKKPLSSLRDFGPAWGLQPDGDSVVFVDNHDRQREELMPVLTHKEPKHYKMAVAFMLAWPHGFPRIMSSYNFTTKDDPPPQDEDHKLLSVTVNYDGTCGNGWICEHRWPQIYSMIEFSNIVQGTPVNTWWDNRRSQISFCRGENGFIIFNGEDTEDINQVIQTCLPEGTYCDIISGEKVNNTCTGKVININSERRAKIQILSSEEDGFMAVHIQSKL